MPASCEMRSPMMAVGLHGNAVTSFRRIGCGNNCRWHAVSRRTGRGAPASHDNLFERKRPGALANPVDRALTVVPRLDRGQRVRYRQPRSSVQWKKSTRSPRPLLARAASEISPTRWEWCSRPYPGMLTVVAPRIDDGLDDLAEKCPVGPGRVLAKIPRRRRTTLQAHAFPRLLRHCSREMRSCTSNECQRSPEHVNAGMRGVLQRLPRARGRACRRGPGRIVGRRMAAAMAPPLRSLHRGDGKRLQSRPPTPSRSSWCMSRLSGRHAAARRLIARPNVGSKTRFVLVP